MAEEEKVSLGIQVSRQSRQWLRQVAGFAGLRMPVMFEFIVFEYVKRHHKKLLKKE